MADAPISYADLTSGVAAFLVAHQDLLQQKYNRRGTSLSAADSNLNATAQWPNFVDNQILAIVKAIEDGIFGVLALPPITGQSTDAVPFSLGTVATLGTNGDTYRIRGYLVGVGDTDAKRVVVELAGFFYRAAGVVAVIAPVNVVTQVGLTVASVALGINGDDVEIQITAQAGQTIDWQALITAEKVN